MAKGKRLLSVLVEFKVTPQRRILNAWNSPKAATAILFICVADKKLKGIWT